VRTLFYVHHSLGIGHLVRILQLADAFVELGPVCLISGGEFPETLKINKKIILKRLPPLDMRLDGRLENTNSNSSPEMILAERSGLTTKIAADFKPDVLIVEMFPFGRKKFRNEIISLIRQVRSEPNSRILCSVRDILVTERRNQSEFDRLVARRLNKYFDVVLVHADSRFVGLEKTYSAYGDINIPVHYTGYISRPFLAQENTREQRIIVSAGGGRVGRTLLRTAAQSFARIKAETGLDMLIIAGPLAGNGLFDGTDCPGLTIVPFVRGLPQVLARSQVSLSQCGYNTFTDILQSRVPSILVPFAAENENEQYFRAKLLQESGRAILLRESALTTRCLIKAIFRAQETDTTCRINLDGVEKSRQIVHGLHVHG